MLVPALAEQLATPGPYLFPRSGTSKPYGPNWRVHDVMARACVRAGLIKGWRSYCFRTACGWKGQLEHEATERECPECKRGLRWKAVAQDLRFKHLRSTWGTVAYSVTRDLRLVADVLGHADIETTRMHYAATIPEHVQAGAEATATALSPWRLRGVTTEEAGGQQRKPTPTQEGRTVNEVKDLARQGKAGEAAPHQACGFLNRRPQVRFLSGSLPKPLSLLGISTGTRSRDFARPGRQSRTEDGDACSPPSESERNGGNDGVVIGARGDVLPARNRAVHQHGDG
nr:hypothetical protein [Myxococcus vastator]